MKRTIDREYTLGYMYARVISVFVYLHSTAVDTSAAPKYTERRKRGEETFVLLFFLGHF